MRLIFYVFLISQILNFVGAFAEKVKEIQPEFGPVKWRKFEEDKINSPKKIIWKSYKDDESYFQKDHQENIYKEKNKSLFDENFKFGGLTVDNSILFKRGESRLKIDYDSSGNFFGSYSYSLSNKFQINLINAGSLKIKNNVIRKNSQLSDIYLAQDNLNFRFGGKFLFFCPERIDLLCLSSRVSMGRTLYSRKGYIYTDLTNTINLNNWINFNISPKYIFTEVGNVGAIGLSNNMKLADKFEFISETNLGITKNSSDNSTFSLRYAYSPRNSIDFFATNSVSFQDIGTMLSINDYKFGIRMNYSF